MSAPICASLFLLSSPAPFFFYVNTYAFFLAHSLHIALFFSPVRHCQAYRVRYGQSEFRASCDGPDTAPIGAIEIVLGSAIDFVRFFFFSFRWYVIGCIGAVLVQRVSYSYALPCIGC